MRLLSHLLATFALGLIATGVVLGLLPGGDCGRAFSGGNAFTDPNGCATSRAERRALPVALVGLGITAGIAAAVAASARIDAERERSSED